MNRYFLLFAGILVLATMLIAVGCGGGGSNPVTPPPPANQNPVVVPPPPTIQSEYRVDAFSKGDGGNYVTQATIVQGTTWDIQLAYQYRERKGVEWGPWLHVSGDTMITALVNSTPSGVPIPDLGLSGTQFLVRLGLARIEFKPPVGGDLGTTRVRIIAPKAETYLDVTIIAGSGTGGEPTCQELHPITPIVVNGYWWDCVGGIWTNTGPYVPPTGSKDLLPLQPQLNGFYSGSGQQSLTLELKPAPAGVGFVNWEITSGPSGAMTVPLGGHPQLQCEFYYTASGVYSVQATPFASEQSFDSGGASVGQPAIFTVNIANG